MAKRAITSLCLATTVWLCCIGGGSLRSTSAAQPIFQGDGAPDDAVTAGILAQEPVPRTIHQIRERLRQHGGVLRTHLVANGGHEHPRPDVDVMFMAFETYAGPIPGGQLEEGDLFLGFFLGPDGRALRVRDGFVELIAWDRKKQVFNFWELIGPDWFYRGDSTDALANGALLGMANPGATFVFTRKSPDGEPVLRCSGCHTLGAPIMKELAPPHNDWWRTGVGLPLDGLRPDVEAARIFAEATDASNLALWVRSGIDRLVARPVPAASLKSRMRSLFSTMEMNLESDSAAFQTRVESRTPVEIPPAFFVDARLSGNAANVAVDLATYQGALADTDSRFPPASSTVSRETRNAFLVPVRSYMDNRIIDRLMDDGLLDDELVSDVLAVDMSMPVYSRSRASLIRFVPDAWRDVRDLRERLIAALRQAPDDDAAARELLANLTDPVRTAQAHRRAAASYLESCRRIASTPGAVARWLRFAHEQRSRIEQSDTATHPSGLITEEGFRQIFPSMRSSGDHPLRLSTATCAAEPRS